MVRRKAWGRAGLAVLALSLMVLPLAQAADFGGTGEVMEISTLNTVLSTGWGLISGTAGKMLAAVLMTLGCTKIGTGNERDRPLLKIGSGVGVAVVPPMVTSVYEVVPAATGALEPLHTLASRVLDGFLGVHLAFDPVFYLALAGTAMALTLVSVRQRREVATL